MEQQSDGPLGAYTSRISAGADATVSGLPLKIEQRGGDVLRLGGEGVSDAALNTITQTSTMGDPKRAATGSFSQGGVRSDGSGKPGEEARDEKGEQSSLAASERPTVVRIKRRRTESPLDALMLEVASREHSGGGLSDAIVRLAIEERPTARKLFRRIDTVSEADLRAEGAGESLLQRLNGLRQTGIDAEGISPERGMPARTREEPSRGESSIAKAWAESRGVGDEQDLENAGVKRPPSAPVFQATHSEKGPAAKRSPAKHARIETHGQSKEDALSENLRKGRQQELMTSARKGRLEAASAARYEQVRGRRGAADPMGELFRLYDVIRVDEEEEWRRAEREAKKRAVHEMSERRMLLMNYLPLLRETVPTAAADLQAPATWQDDGKAAEDDVSDGEDYVYDVFALEEGATDEADGADELHPVVRVADDLDMRPTDDAPSDYDSEDSNDENNPDNDYPEDEFDGAIDAVSDASTQDRDLDVYADDDEEYDVMAYDEEDSDEEGVRVGAAMSSWAMRR